MKQTLETGNRKEGIMRDITMQQSNAFELAGFRVQIIRRFFK